MQSTQLPSTANFIVHQMQSEIHLRKVIYSKPSSCLTSTQTAFHVSAPKHASDQKEELCWDVLRIKVNCGKAFKLNSFSAQRGMKKDMWCRRSSRATAFTRINFSNLWRTFWVYKCFDGQKCNYIYPKHTMAVQVLTWYPVSSLGFFILSPM